MKKTPGSAHLNFTMGGLAMAGGAAGYMRKGSKISLVAGLTFGSLFLGSGWMISNDSEYQGHVLGAGAGGFMAAGMSQRFVTTRKFMPAGLVASLGALVCAYNVKKAIDWAPSDE